MDADKREEWKEVFHNAMEQGAFSPEPETLVRKLAALSPAEVTELINFFTDHPEDVDLPFPAFTPPAYASLEQAKAVTVQRNAEFEATRRDKLKKAG